MRPKVTFSITATDEAAIISFEFALSNNPKAVALLINKLMGEIARIDNNRPMDSFARELHRNREIVKAVDSITWVLNYKFLNPDFPKALIRALTPFAVVDSALLN